MLDKKLIKTATLTVIITAITGCKAPVSGSIDGPESIVTAATSAASAPLSLQFKCLPEEAAFIAAHRAVSKGEGYAENSGSSLAALIEKGILFAEVDIAGLKDGTHILYHDGVWEEKSTGRGAVPASSWADAEKILLNDTDGNLTADRPIKLRDALALAKDKLYLEIDFKSSAKYAAVINEIRDAGMADRVILIAYNKGQAAKLAKLAPEMAQSVTLKSEADIKAHEAAGVSRANMKAWLGRGPYNADFISRLKADNITVLAWPNRNKIAQTAKPAGLIVSDYAFSLDPIVGLSAKGRAAYEACLAQG